MTQARDEAAAAAAAAVAAQTEAAERASSSPAQPLQEESVDAAAVVEMEGQLEAVKTEVLTLQRAPLSVPTSSLSPFINTHIFEPMHLSMSSAHARAAVSGWGPDRLRREPRARTERENL